MIIKHLHDVSVVDDAVRDDAKANTEYDSENYKKTRAFCLKIKANLNLKIKSNCWIYLIYQFTMYAGNSLYLEHLR
jgi:hypothetical protein